MIKIHSLILDFVVFRMKILKQQLVPDNWDKINKHLIIKKRGKKNLFPIYNMNTKSNICAVFKNNNLIHLEAKYGPSVSLITSSSRSVEENDYTDIFKTIRQEQYYELNKHNICKININSVRTTSSFTAELCLRKYLSDYLVDDSADSLVPRILYINLGDSLEFSLHSLTDIYNKLYFEELSEIYENEDDLVCEIYRRLFMILKALELEKYLLVFECNFEKTFIEKLILYSLFDDFNFFPNVLIFAKDKMKSPVNYTYRYKDIREHTEVTSFDLNYVKHLMNLTRPETLEVYLQKKSKKLCV